MYGKVLNMLLNCLPKLSMFLFETNLNIKGDRKKKKPKNQKERAKQTSQKLRENVVKQNSFINFRTLRCAVKR